MTSLELQNRSRISHLDGLRGLLALVVFIHHFIFCFAPAFIIGGESEADANSGAWTIYKLFAYTPLNVLYNPGIAVGLFFIISGYVLSHSYLQTQNTQILQEGALKRYIRLALPVLGSCLLLWLFHKLGMIYKSRSMITDLNRNWVLGMLPDSLNFFELIKYSLVDVFGGNSRYNPVLWTMSTELFGSFFVFVFLLITHKISLWKKISLLALALCFQIYITSYATNFTLGITLALLQTAFPAYSRTLSLRSVKFVLLLVGLYLASYPYYGTREGVQRSMYELIFSGSVDVVINLRMAGNALLLSVFLSSDKLRSLFSAKIFPFLGKISFGLYLIHLPVIFVVASRSYEFFYKYLHDYANVPITFLITLAFLLGLSWLFYRFIDFYAITWASKFAKFFWR